MSDSMPGAPTPQSRAPEQQPVPFADSEAVRQEAVRAGARSMPFKAITPTAEMAPYLAPDGVPLGIRKFNWGALFLPQWWTLAYGLNNWFFIAFGVLFFGNFLVQLASSLPLVLLIAVAQVAISIYYGLTVNRAYWAANPKRLTVDQFKAKQPKWIAIGGVIFFLINIVFPVAAFMTALSTAADL